MAQVQRHDGGLGRDLLGVEHGRGSLRVDKNVELGPGRVVADSGVAVDLAEGRVRESLADGAAHETHALDMADELRMLAEEGTDIGQGAGGDDPCGAGGLGADGLSHGLDAWDGRGRDERLGEQIGAIETRVAVNICRRMNGRAFKGLV